MHRERCFLYTSDMCIKASKLADFCPLKTLVSECHGEVAGIARGDCGDACNSELFFPRKPSAQTLGSPGTGAASVSADMKGEAGGSSWRVPPSSAGPCSRGFVAHWLCSPSSTLLPSFLIHVPTTGLAPLGGALRGDLCHCGSSVGREGEAQESDLV
jgi:hypothetical protein